MAQKPAAPAKRKRIPAPVSDRSVTLNFMGDWGRANLHRAFGWLSHELGDLFGPHTKIGIWNGSGQMKNIWAVGRGEIDVAMATPQSFVTMAYKGKGPFANERYPHLRALGHVPQHDRLIFAIRKEFGINSWDDFRRKKPKLRISCGSFDGESFMGMAVQRQFEASGFTIDELKSWGCTFIQKDSPVDCVTEVTKGNADAVFQEAVMTMYWHALARDNELTYLGIEPKARDRLKKELEWPSAKLPKGYLRGMDREMEFLDYSHFLLITTTALPDDIAYAIAWSLIETWDHLEMQYRHLPPERSPVSYPIDPRLACKTAIPLHPGAERYFREAGYL